MINSLGGNLMLKRAVVFNIVIVLSLFFIKNYNCFAEDTWTVYNYYDDGVNLGSARVYAVAIDPNDNGKTVWFGGRPNDDQGWTGGLSKFDTEVNEWTLFTTDNSSLPHNWVWDIEFDSQGNMWIGTKGAGLAKFVPPYGSGDWTIYGEGSGIGYKNIYEVSIDSQNNIWLGHGPPDATDITRAMSVFDGVSNWQTFGTPTLAENAVYAIIFDGEGNKWCATKTQGIYVLNDGGTPFDTGDDTWTHYTTSNGLASNNFNATAADYVNGHLWFGHDVGNGVDEWNGSTWTNHIDYQWIRAITHDWRGYVWCGEKRGHDDASGIFIYDGSNWEYLSESDGLGWNVVNMIAINDSTGDVWIAHDGGVDGFAVTLLQGRVPPKPEVSLHQSKPIVVEGFNLYQNYPNPFNPETSIKFSLDQPQHVRLSIYSLGGQLIRILENEYKQAGIHTACWDGRDENGYVVSSGIYIYRIESDYGYHVMKKAVFIK